MKVLMRTLAAGPERILHPGKVYNLPPEVAREFLDAKPVAFATLAPEGAKVTKLPSQPDPGDTGEGEEVDE